MYASSVQSLARCTYARELFVRWNHGNGRCPKLDVGLTLSSRMGAVLVRGRLGRWARSLRCTRLTRRACRAARQRTRRRGSCASSLGCVRRAACRGRTANRGAVDDRQDRDVLLGDPAGLWDECRLSLAGACAAACGVIHVSMELFSSRISL